MRRGWAISERSANEVRAESSRRLDRLQSHGHCQRCGAAILLGFGRGLDVHLLGCESFALNLERPRIANALRVEMRDAARESARALSRRVRRHSFCAVLCLG